VKRQWRYQLALLVLLTLTSAPLLGQYWFEEPPPRWSLNGDAGFNFNKNNLSVHTVNDHGSSGDTLIGGIADGNLHGFLFTPKFLDFNAGVNEVQSSTTSSTGGGLINTPETQDRNGALGYSASAVFLSGRGMPLIVHYLKTDSGLTSPLTKQDEGTNEFGLDWRARLPYARNVFLTFRDSKSNVAIPTSFLDTNNKQKSLQMGGNDVFHDWVWNANGSLTSQQIDSLGASVLPVSAYDHTRNENVDIRRDFLDDLFTFNAGEQLTRDRTTGSAGDTDFDQFEYRGGLRFRPTRNISTGLTYTHQELKTLGTLAVIPGLVQPALIPSTNISLLNGDVTYRPWKFLTLRPNLAYTATRSDVQMEELESDLTPGFGATAMGKLRSFDVTAHGGVNRHMTTSNFGQHADALADNYGFSVGRGNVQTIRWTGTFDGRHDVLPQIIGSYMDTRRAALTAETGRLRNWRLLGGVDYNQNNTLTVGGRFKNDGWGFNAGARKENYGFRFYREHSSGVGSIFSNPFNAGVYLVDLPIAYLASSPLLDKTTTVNGLTGYFYWHCWTANGTLTRERDLFSTTNQQFNYVDVDARYKLGKFTFDFGYGRNVLNTGLIGEPLNGTVFNRFRIRLTRSFTIF
jgi:hypothetical protein